tara:strand:+ start:75 stop:383 length:309 start_codon:yes stop_codon:yes gene_type:complete
MTIPSLEDVIKLVAGCPNLQCLTFVDTTNIGEQLAKDCVEEKKDKLFEANDSLAAISIIETSSGLDFEDKDLLQTVFTRDGEETIEWKRAVAMMTCGRFNNN